MGHDLEHDRVEEHSVPPVLPPVSWRQFLLRDYQTETADSTDGFWSAILLLVWIIVFVVVTLVLVKNWPSEPKVYTSNIAIPRNGYTCGCSLPLNLVEPKSKESTNAKAVNFNQCYPRSSLETITVLQYLANHTGLDAKVQQYTPEDAVFRYGESPGYLVSEEAHELSVGRAEQLTSLYRNEEMDLADEDVPVTLQGYVLQRDFVPLPQSYVRMAFRYECIDCSSCGLEVMEGYLRYVTRATNETWGMCYYWLRSDDLQCSANNSYTGKCVLYPTKTVPFSFALTTFIHAVNNTEGIKSIRSLSSRDKGSLNYGTVQSNVVYLTRSQVTEEMLHYGFVESPRGSSLWAWVVTTFPGSDTACYNVPDNSSSICNGSSVCNAFVKDDDSRSIQLKCKRWKDDLDCERTVNDSILSLDNKYGSDDGVLIDAICYKPPHSCLSKGPKVPAYKVAHFAPANYSDPLNAYLLSNGLQDKWLRISGLCTNTYKEVYRYNNTMFLQAKCTTGTDLCSMTGSYYLLNDFSGQNRSLPKYSDMGSGDLFVCYKIGEQPWGLWLLNYVSVLFSWLGILLFLYLSGVYKFYRFLRARYAHRQNRHHHINWIIDILHRIRSFNLRGDSPIVRFVNL